MKSRILWLVLVFFSSGPELYESRRGPIGHRRDLTGRDDNPEPGLNSQISNALEGIVKPLTDLLSLEKNDKDIAPYCVISSDNKTEVERYLGRSNLQKQPRTKYAARIQFRRLIKKSLNKKKKWIAMRSPRNRRYYDDYRDGVSYTSLGGSPAFGTGSDVFTGPVPNPYGAPNPNPTFTTQQNLDANIETPSTTGTTPEEITSTSFSGPPKNDTIPDSADCIVVLRNKKRSPSKIPTFLRSSLRRRRGSMRYNSY